MPGEPRSTNKATRFSFSANCKRGAYVFAASTKFKQLANNRLAGDDSDFNASPAVSDGQMFIRSNQFLYCIQE